MLTGDISTKLIVLDAQQCRYWDTGLPPYVPHADPSGLSRLPDYDLSSHRGTCEALSTGMAVKPRVNSKSGDRRTG